MARQRILRPSFFTNEDLGECSPLARLFFAGLWCHADRAGYLEDRPKRLRAEILPYDPVEGDTLVAELEGKGFVVREAVDGVRVIRIPNFLKYQDPHPRETPSRFDPNGTKPNEGEPKADLAAERHGSAEQRTPKPSCPSRPSSPSKPTNPPNPPAPLASVPGWLVGIQETLSEALGRPVAVGNDPAAVVEAFERLRAAYVAEGRDDPEALIVADCLEVSKRSRSGPPGTLGFFVGWFKRVVPQNAGRG